MATNYSIPRRSDTPSTPREAIVVKARVDGAGRVLIPARFRKAMSVETGTAVMLTLKENAIEVRSVANAIRDAQSLVRSYVPENRSLVGELIRERRREAEGE